MRVHQIKELLQGKRGHQQDERLFTEWESYHK